MKKNVVFMILLLMISTPMLSVGQTNVKETPEYQRQLNVYNLAKRYNDVTAIRNSIYQIIAINPDEKAWLDTLALFYFEYEQYGAAALVTNDAITIDPDNLLALEVNAISMENIGLKENAVNRYQSLYIKEPSLTLLYKIAFLQYELERLTECETIINQVMDDQQSIVEKVNFQGEGEEVIEVTMNTAVKNLLGLVRLQQGKTEEAIKIFEEILYEHPTFALVKQNLATAKGN
ncbi:tetratricopeptide repeat protein [Peijinzhouia sedimentorum]